MNKSKGTGRQSAKNDENRPDATPPLPEPSPHLIANSTLPPELPPSDQADALLRLCS